MRLHLPALCALAALAVGCSSGSDGSATDPDSNGGQLDDQGALLDAGNFDTLLASGLELLRAEYYVDAIALLAEVALAWEQPQQAVVGATEHVCPGGGLVSRTVTEATDASVSPPAYKLVSDLIFTDCTAGSRVLNGTVGWNWNRSSPAQIASATFTNDYRFVDFSMS
ncbi:MAG: hypothetical protein HKN42_16415, partial [Granulosicoccus sp.]|nr:hypothetical protein [Granulosicoccus sp.]